MKGFHFRLEPILTLRRHVEDALQCQLAESMRELEEEEQRACAIRDKILGHVGQLPRNPNPGVVDVQTLLMESSYLAVLERQLSDQLNRVKEQSSRVEEARDAVLKASQEKKAMQKLRESRLEVFARDLSYKDQRAAEEMATVSFLNRRQGQLAP